MGGGCRSRSHGTPREVTLDTELSTEKETGEQEHGGPAVVGGGGAQEHSALGQRQVSLGGCQLPGTKPYVLGDSQS